jgi:hypothetical protein
MDRIFIGQEAAMLKRIKIYNSISNSNAKPRGAVFATTPEDSEWKILNWEIGAINIGGGNPTLGLRIVSLVE